MTEVLIERRGRHPGQMIGRSPWLQSVHVDTDAVPGDILQVESEILEKIPSRSRPDRGMATMRSETHNQRGEVLQILTAKIVVPRRAASEG